MLPYEKQMLPYEQYQHDLAYSQQGTKKTFFENIAILAVWVVLFCLVALSWKVFFDYISPPAAHAQVIGDGLPEHLNTSVPTNITYSDANGNIISESFNAPDVKKDFANVTYIDTSPIDGNRIIDALPTFGLAEWHHWLMGGEILPHAQKDYAVCLGEVRANERIKGVKPGFLINDPGSPIFDLVNSVLFYVVPFKPIQRWDGNKNLPPTIVEARAHVRAAIDSINITVYNTGLCNLTRLWMQDLVAEQRAKEVEDAYNLGRYEQLKHLPVRKFPASLFAVK